jgi:hypothetical protein
MAGYVSRKSADRWNNAARIVEAGGAGNRFVPGKYRETRKVCTDLPAPGSYPAVAGASIAAGATGSVVYDGTVYQIKNHSQCAVRFGDLIGLHISPKCEPFFVPCVCSCDEPDPTLACDKSYSICIAGQTHILGIGSIFNTCWNTCCILGGALLELCGYLTCDEGTDQIYFNWTIGIGLSGFSGQIELTDLFSTGTAIESLDLSSLFTCTAGSAIIEINAADELIDCNDCNDDPPSNPCCEKLRYVCVNGVSVQLALDGGTNTFDVTECCEGCTLAELELTFTCNESTGNVNLEHTYTCDAGTPDSGTTNVSALCSSNAPLVVNILTPCFIQILITLDDQGCSECGAELTTTP